MQGYTEQQRIYSVFCNDYRWSMGLPGGSVVKNLPAIARDSGSIPGLEFTGEGNGNPL